MALDPTGAMSTMAPFAQAQMTGQNQNPTLKGMVNLKNMIDQAESAYLADSSIYDEEQIMQLNQVSQQVRGRRFGPQGNINSDVSGDNFIYGMANTALFGAPEFIARGLFNSSLAGDTAAEKKAFGYGEIAGIAPALFTGGAAFRGLQAGAKAMGAGTKLAGIMAGATEGGIYGALTGAASDPNVGPTGLSGKGAIDQGLMNAGIGGIVGPLGGAKLVDKGSEMLAKLRGAPAGGKKATGFLGKMFGKKNTLSQTTQARVLRGEEVAKEEADRLIKKATDGEFNVWKFSKGSGKRKKVNTAAKWVDDLDAKVANDIPLSPQQEALRKALSENLEAVRKIDADNLSIRFQKTTAATTVNSRFGSKEAKTFIDDVVENSWANKVAGSTDTRAQHYSKIEKALNLMDEDEVIKFKKGLDLRKQLDMEGADVLDITSKIKALEGQSVTVDGAAQFVTRKINSIASGAGVTKNAQALDDVVMRLRSSFAGKAKPLNPTSVNKVLSSPSMRKSLKYWAENATEAQRNRLNVLLEEGKTSSALKEIRALYKNRINVVPTSAAKPTAATTPTTATQPAQAGTAAPISTAEAPATGAPASSESILSQLGKSENQGQMGIV